MTPLPSIRQLHYLLTLSEHLNFTRAAEACFVTQSTLSTGLRELEDLLGVKLVERDRQTVLMTPIGQEITHLSSPQHAHSIGEIIASMGNRARGAAAKEHPDVARFRTPIRYGNYESKD